MLGIVGLGRRSQLRNIRFREGTVVFDFVKQSQAAGVSRDRQKPVHAIRSIRRDQRIRHQCWGS